MCWINHCSSRVRGTLLGQQGDRSQAGVTIYLMVLCLPKKSIYIICYCVVPPFKKIWPETAAVWFILKQEIVDLLLNKEILKLTCKYFMKNKFGNVGMKLWVCVCAILNKLHCSGLVHIVQNVLAPPNKNSNNKFTDYVYNYLISKKKKSQWLMSVEKQAKNLKSWKIPSGCIMAFWPII